MSSLSIRPISGSVASRSSSQSSFPQPDGIVLTEKLGTGTYATVYKGCNKDSGDVVAVKCIERRRLNSTSTENLLTEIKVMRSLEHSYIVKLLNFQWNSSHIFLIMEYCSGGDLSMFIRSRQLLGENVTRRFLRQLALALQFLRAKGIAHMDLKPQNLLLSSRTKPVLKIADFGMVQHLNSGDHAQSFRGSPLYMAPEIMLGQKYDAKVDLWSVGVILHEALFGEAPFASETLEELHMKVLDERPIELPRRPEISTPCADLLLGLLQRNPQDRISFDKFFSHPYLDLEHMPSAECLPKARELVKIAVEEDSKGNCGVAFKHYRRALHFFVPAIEFEEDPAIKEHLKQMVEQYMERAEDLKSLVRSRRPSLRNSHLPTRVLEAMKPSSPQLREALELASEADQLEDRLLLQEALKKYEQAVEKLLPLIQTSAGEEKRALSAEAKAYLQRAEELAAIDDRKLPSLRHPSSPASSVPSSSMVSTFRAAAEEKCKIQ